MRAVPPTLETVLDGLADDDPAFLVTFVEYHGHLAVPALRAGGVPEELLDPALHDVATALLSLARAERTAGRDRAATDLVGLAVAEVLARYASPADGRNAGRPAPRGARHGTRAAGPRSLHLVDLENLVGGPRRAGQWLRPTVHAYEAVAPVGPADQVIAAADITLWRRSAFDLPGWRYLPGRGPDGADRALLDEAPPAWVADRFERLVIGSGDRAFAPLALAVRAAGREVVAVARPRQLSAALRRAATCVRPLPDLPGKEGR
jgi:hypothetical protein